MNFQLLNCFLLGSEWRSPDLQVPLSLVGLLVSWDTSTTLGVQLRESLRTNESSVSWHTQQWKCLEQKGSLKTRMKILKELHCWHKTTYWIILTYIDIYWHIFCKKNVLSLESPEIVGHLSFGPTSFTRFGPCAPRATSKTVPRSASKKRWVCDNNSSCLESAAAVRLRNCTEERTNWIENGSFYVFLCIF